MLPKFLITVLFQIFYYKTWILKNVTNNLKPKHFKTYVFNYFFPKLKSI